MDWFGWMVVELMDFPVDQIAGHYLTSGAEGSDDDEPGLRSGLDLVGEYRSRSVLEEHGLMLLSIGMPYWVIEVEGAMLQLFVPEQSGARVRDELVRYDAMNIAWRESLQRPALPDKDYRAGIHFAFLYVVVLLTGFYYQRRLAWVEEGLLNDNHALFTSGQWWRPLTALFLHADPGHLLSNLAMGVIFGLICAKSMGAAASWGLILLGGVLGNLLTAWSYFPDLHRSLGASTSVFAAVGLLSGHGVAFTLRDRGRATLLRKLLPLLGGLILLGWYGFGDSLRTDYVAHLWGFACGTALGLPFGNYQLRQLQKMAAN